GGASGGGGRGAGTQHFYTTAGALDENQVGDVLAHHHMFVELGAVPPVAYKTADREQVNSLLAPWLRDAKALGIGVFVEMTPEGVGRRPDIVKYVADQAGLPTMLVTGIYREPFMPDWVYGASVGQIADFMLKELKVGVGDTGVPAGIIKLSQNATGMTLTERKVLQAACIAAKKTGAAIASHITAGPTALSVMDALEGFGCPLSRYRFIWIHSMLTAASAGATLEGNRTGQDAGMDYLMAAAKRGAYVSLDGIGSSYWGPTYGGYDANIAWIRQLVTAGYQNRIIIGADTGWYDPGFPAGFKITQLPDGSWVHDPADVPQYMQDYRSVPGEFVPAMRAAGLSETLIHKLMHSNPWNAYSR
ncbi:MAG: phosphotriesterase family protein, partial [Candidatus Limnocylindrales bacterium]